MPIVAEQAGGLSTSNPIVLANSNMEVRDGQKRMICPMALRFHTTPTGGFCLIAIDITGKVIKKNFGP
jgi:hypothetical protein